MSEDKKIKNTFYTLGIDIGSTTVKIAILNQKHQIMFADYERHFADIQNTLARLLDKAISDYGRNFRDTLLSLVPEDLL